MNNIEEILWNYIDGNCSPEEYKTISALILQDETYRLKYDELITLNKQISLHELDEPPMAFTFNVMEAVRMEHARVPLQTSINKKRIMGIVVFFAVILLCLLIFVLSNTNWTAHGQLSSLDLNIKLPDISISKAKIALNGFVFFDVILGLYLIDAWLRKNAVTRHH